MKNRTHLTTLLIGALVLACSDSAGPPQDSDAQAPVVQAADFTPLAWSTPATRSLSRFSKRPGDKAFGLIAPSKKTRT